ncbi:MAG TPA: TetR/AcrR family transcriptional regulator [Solirubrobacteraceae bacterium]|jgi:AcrR family transcriptional regulator|nr:TetR/AcrR family transcriptional regulator [Solirubrobacteraceae bacterium]
MPPPARRPVQGLRERRSTPRKDAVTPKRTQRERLTDAIIELSTKGGYQGVSVAQISSHARVSSATFYELFDGKEDCLLAAYRSVADRLLAKVREQAPDSEDWRASLQGSLASLLTALREDPDGGRLLFVEAAAGGELIAEERRRVLGEFERLAQSVLDGIPEGDERLDVPATAFVGALRSIISRRLRTNAADQLPEMTEDIIEWLASYAIPPGAEPWSAGPRALLQRTRTQAPKPQIPARPRLPRGRHGLPAAVVARSQRTRIIYATADVTMAKGYANTTVADIVAEAGVARDVFYEHFADKQDAFLEAQQHPTQHIVDTCAGAYFSATSWPERVWNGLGALLGLIASAPAVSHLRLVECYAAGPVAIRRGEEITRSFTIFLEEGYAYRPEAQHLPRVSSEAIAGAAFEIVQRHAVRHDFAGLPARLPQLTYIALAPFTGPEQAVRLIEELSRTSPAGAPAGAGA